jgi:hypothetical protein
VMHLPRGHKIQSLSTKEGTKLWSHSLIGSCN